MQTTGLWIGLAAAALCACGSAEGPGAADGSGGNGPPQGSGGIPAVGGTSAGGTVGSGGTMLEGSGGASGGSESSGGADGSGGSSSGGTASGGAAAAGGSGGEDSGLGDGCPFLGHVEYQLNNPESWPDDVVPLITAAMDDAVEHYNCYADLTKSITVNYNPGVPTAEANVDGYLSFGSNQTYMQVATAMHEVAHTLGVSYFPWDELIEEGRWTGPNVNEVIQNLPAEERDPDAESQRDYITTGGGHFWPYGLNYPEEHVSEWSLINNVRIVAAMQKDKQAYLDGDL